MDQQIKWDVHSACSALIQAIVPPLEVIICADSLAIHAPVLRREDGAFNPHGFFRALVLAVPHSWAKAAGISLSGRNFLNKRFPD